MQRTANEQLRIDHIKTLELLEKSTRENTKLKQQLKKYISDETATTIEDEDENFPAVESTQQHETLADLASEVKKKDRDIDILKLKLRDAEKASFTRGRSTISHEEYTSEIGKMQSEVKKMHSQMDNYELELKHKERLAAENLHQLKDSNDSYLKLRFQYDELLEINRKSKNSSPKSSRMEENCRQCSGLTLACSSLQGELNEMAVQSASNDLNRQNAENMLRLKENEITIAQQTMNRKDAETAKQLQRKEAIISNLEQGLRNMTTDLLSCRIQLAETQKNLEQAEVHNLLSPNPVRSVDQHSQQHAHNNNCGAIISRCPTCFRSITQSEQENTDKYTFDQFIALKRENKELKMALTEYLDMMNPQKIGRGSSGIGLGQNKHTNKRIQSSAENKYIQSSASSSRQNTSRQHIQSRSASGSDGEDGLGQEFKLRNQGGPFTSLPSPTNHARNSRSAGIPNLPKQPSPLTALTARESNSRPVTDVVKDSKSRRFPPARGAIRIPM